MQNLQKMWDILKVYKEDDRVKQVWLQTLRSELESMGMETEAVAKYITRVEIVANQLSRNREMLPTS